MRNLCILFLIFSSTSSLLAQDKLIDSRDGNIYATVKIGDSEWMQENLRYKHPSAVYNRRKRKLKKFGNFYSNSALQEICPDGWNLPTLTQWEAMLNHLQIERGLVTIDTSTLTEDFNVELVHTQVIEYTSDNMNLFDEPLMLNGFGWVDKGIRRRFLKTANLWVIDDKTNQRNYHLHISNNAVNSHHHKHHIEVKKRKKRHFNVRCIKE